MFMDERSKALVALRAKWTKFGLNVLDANNVNGKVASYETPQIFELGDVDPIEKNAKQYINELLATEAKITPVLRDPGLRKVQVEIEEREAEKRRQLEEARKASEAKRAAADAPGPSKKAGGTWAETMAAKRANKGAEKGEAARTKFIKDIMTGKMIEVDLTTLRVVGLHGVSETELRRLFGEENGLGGLIKLKMPKDENGQVRGFAYISYRTPEEAEAARKKMDGKTFKFIKFAIDYSAVTKPK